MGNVGRRREAPVLHRRYRPEVYQFAPAPAQVIAEEEARRLGSNVDPRPAIKLDGLDAEDLAFAQTVAALFPGVAAVAAHTQGAATVSTGEDRAALGLYEKRAYVPVGQAAAGHPPAAVIFDKPGDAAKSPDEHFPRRLVALINRRSTVGQRNRHI